MVDLASVEPGQGGMNLVDAWCDRLNESRVPGGPQQGPASAPAQFLAHDGVVGSLLGDVSQDVQHDPLLEHGQEG